MEELRVEIDYFHGEKVKIRYLGTGRFEKIDVRDEKGNILYYLQKDISPLSSSEDFRIPRREYFAGERKPERIYKGWKNSFIEFCRSFKKFRKIPGQKELLALAKELRISKKYAGIYAEYYKKLFMGKAVK
jgi:hypothetical protein